MAVLSSMLVGFVVGCMVMWSGGVRQQLEANGPAANMAWSALQPGAVATSRFSPLFAMPNSPVSRLSMRFPEFRSPSDVAAHATKMQVPSRNMQNRPRQHQGAESSWVDSEWEQENQRKAAEARAALTYFDSAKARQEAESPTAPFPVNIFVHQSEIKSVRKGSPSYSYLEKRIVDALSKAHKQVRSVDVRLHVEGQKPKTYRLETTVRFEDHHKEDSFIVSKSIHSKLTFFEAVDHMHDVLRRQMVNEKEKHISKIKHARKAFDKSMAEAEAAPVGEDDFYSFD